MVKFVPLISSWQLLFVRCTLQVEKDFNKSKLYEQLSEVGLTLLESGYLPCSTPYPLSQLFAMIPLIWVSGENIFGTPDFATRYSLRGACYSLHCSR